MEFTGERVIPGQVDADLWQEHISRYILAREWAKGSRVLDAGCGTGYGAALLAEAAQEVTGLDNSTEALEFARAHYGAPHLRFELGDCSSLPFPDGKLDLVVAFEVIEHLADAAAFLREARRVLAPGGRLAVSTPNRRFYTEERGFHNPFHVREFDASEFQAILEQHFPHCAILEQNHVPAISFALPGQAPANLQSGRRAGQSDQAHFFVAVCSPSPLPPLNGLVYLAHGGNVLREREKHIQKLESDLAGLKEQTDRELAERRAWAEKLQADLEEKGAFIRRMQREAEERAAWVAQLEERVAERQREVERLEGELKDRTEWAQGLDRERAELDTRILERQRAVEELEAELTKRTEWALGLDRHLQQLGEEIARLQRENINLDAQLAERTAWVQQLSGEVNSLRTALQIVMSSTWNRAGRLLRLAPQPFRSAS